MIEIPKESMRRFILNAKAVGMCTFRVFLAKPWEFDFTNISNSKYVRKIEFDLTVYTSDEWTNKYGPRLRRERELFNKGAFDEVILIDKSYYFKFNSFIFLAKN